MRVHDSQAYRKMDVTWERISRILELREILLSIQTGFSFVNVAVACAILDNISGLEPSSVITAKIQQAIGPHEDLTIVKRRKLQWLSLIHISEPTRPN